MWARRAGLSPAVQCLGEILLQDVGDEDQELWAGERARNPVPPTVLSVLIGIQIIEQLRQCGLVPGGLDDPEAQPIQILNAARDNSEADDGQRSLEILENPAGGRIEPVRRPTMIIHAVNATAVRRTGAAVLLLLPRRV